jgi:threonylcarbamoyladenosine tRNA methylthiotransferase MtaB
VQDGCILNCSFCIIPTVRPGLASRAPAAILSEISRLVENGYREIVLTGIHLGHYGVDLNRGRPKAEWLRLSHLLERIVTLPGEFRVRLSSIEATEVTRELVAVMAAYPRRICPHLHISMQSGSDTVLARMRRRWGARRFVDRCRLVQESLDRPAITTDIIVGFPGETGSEFQATCDVATEVGFSKIHIFPFSPRRGTDAARMADQVSAGEKADRAARLAELELRLKLRYFESLLGSRLEALVESPVVARAGWMTGTSCRYAPVEFDANRDSIGQFKTVVAREIRDGRIVGEL